ncbi:unnamed protein product [Dovyalis caffra]|uniref:Uncharacterized protein n=1 Tax=Dovyalis caffra TaxID=77055 RepID=A0AAV1QU14_9ROSI|nr:unnamed protein product [Dovyalis caffra]
MRRNTNHDDKPSIESGFHLSGNSGLRMLPRQAYVHTSDKAHLIDAKGPSRRLETNAAILEVPESESVEEET